MLKFTYDITKEPVNLSYGLSSLNHGGKLSKFAQQMKEDGVDFSNNTAMENYCQKIINSEGINISARVGEAEKAWRAIEAPVFERLIRLFELGQGIGNVQVYLSLNDRCGYNVQSDFFFVSIFSPEANKTCLHELLHFYTHKTIYELFPSQNKQSIFNDYKEALTVLINLEFFDLITYPDKGYAKQQKLRQYIEETWQKGDTVPTYTKHHLDEPAFLSAFSE